ncbi:MAG: 5-(carboxyamino)imidazole ribonucleotide synthase [Flavobacteriaceae bacterium]|nr:5-(carboxyamino)imidazole ribonucleotide synthase [Bacteroidia bacterium]NNK87727.1 5-(carboxyamino)imidazole ribonucleotide synthase [Flavobacteriaceae bacterium]
MEYFSSDFKLGILGGGQLGKMMLTETRKWDIQTFVLDPSPQAPCKIGSHHFQVGDLMDFDTVYNFGKQVDVLTIEIENVNVQALKKLEKEGITVYPSGQTLEVVQSKAKQKLFYVDHNLPTADFSRFGYKAELEAAMTNTIVEYPFVWKSAKFGYDGRGVKIVRNDDDFQQLPNVECIVEELVNFKKELAVIVARSASAEVAAFPVVEMEFHPEANQVEYVICPARISKEVAAKAELIALKASAAFEHVGLLAVEMFQTQDDEILINEVAPRPHNSGHHTIESCFTSQFEQHLRAILGLPLGKASNYVAGVMVNLVGEPGHTGDAIYQNIDAILDLEGVTPHIYGKKETRPFRKMGHVTIINTDVSAARVIAEQVKKTIKVKST